LEENGVKLKLTCIDTPGFGDFINNEDSWKPILETIESRLDAYLQQENRVNRKTMVDTRIHCCLYFIAPTGHSLKPIDIEFMKQIGTRVNLIPIIARSDTLTSEEIIEFKKRILDDMKANGIKYYQPESYGNDDPEIIRENKEFLSKLPFAVVGSDKLITVGKKQVRGRVYPWGQIDIENPEHCDFMALRHMLIQSHMEELKDRTNNFLYENYRIEKLSSMDGGAKRKQYLLFNRTQPNLNGSAAKPDLDRNAHDQKMAKMEAEMKAVFQQKVAEKESKLNQSEDEVSS
jgi:septin 7